MKQMSSDAGLRRRVSSRAGALTKAIRERGRQHRRGRARIGHRRKPDRREGQTCHDPTRPRHCARHPARRRRHPCVRQSRLDRDAAHGRAGRRARHPLRPRPSGGDRGRHGRRLGARLRPRRLRQPACDGRPRQRDGRAGRLQGERDAARRHRRPAGHPASDDRAVAVRRPGRACRAGDQMGQGASPRRRCRPGAETRLRPRPHPAVRAGVPVAADGHPRPGGERPDAAGVFAAAARPVARRGPPGRQARRPRPGSGHCPARRRPAGCGERGAGRVRRNRRLSRVGHSAHFAHRVSVPSSLLGRSAEAGFRRHARTSQVRAGDRAGRRARLRRLSLSRSRAGARGRHSLAHRRQPGGVRTRTRRQHGASWRHRRDAR